MYDIFCNLYNLELIRIKENKNIVDFLVYYEDHNITNMNIV
jgi:hypothetical protein